MKKAQFFIISMILVASAIGIITTYLVISPRISYSGINEEESRFSSALSLNKDLENLNNFLFNHWHIPEASSRHVLNIKSNYDCENCLIEIKVPIEDSGAVRLYNDEGLLYFEYVGGILKFTDNFKSKQEKTYYVYDQGQSLGSESKNIVEGDGITSESRLKQESREIILLMYKERFQNMYLDKGWSVNFNRFSFENSDKIVSYSAYPGSIGTEISYPRMGVIFDGKKTIPTQYGDGKIVFTNKIYKPGYKRFTVVEEALPSKVIHMEWDGNAFSNEHFSFNLGSWYKPLSKINAESGNVRVRVTAYAGSDGFQFDFYEGTSIVNLLVSPNNKTEFGFGSVSGLTHTYKRGIIESQDILREDLFTKNGWTYVAVGDKAIIANINFLDDIAFSTKGGRLTVLTKGLNPEEQYYLYIGDPSYLDSILGLISSYKVSNNIVTADITATSTDYKIETII